ncbi:hypothetical protein [Cecembia lonarensis]|uniref:Lipid A core-O-antigen ligase n=1 Tax=Cecembia lonarensis (strain CCUG 58316 / KCTC 22772 / LW9) TaxID=1225176 RepID=K1L892_CECL9|nr:hypothetical protein [Cecembia lonarensis]EKB48332.1 hypothetical protein B879_03063 [Cecembia lonarensis LW9]
MLLKNKKNHILSYSLSDFIIYFLILALFLLFFKTLFFNVLGADFRGFNLIVFFAIVICIFSLSIIRNDFRIKIEKEYFFLFLGISIISILSSFGNISKSVFLLSYYKTFLIFLFSFFAFQINLGFKNLYILIFASFLILSFFLILSLFEALLLSGTIDYYETVIKYVFIGKADVGSVSIILVSLSLFLFRECKLKNVKYAFLLISFFATGFTAAMGLRRSSIAILFIWFLFFFIFSKNRIKLLFYLIPVIFIGLIVLSNSTLLYRFSNLGVYLDPEYADSIARTLLLIKSFEIANDFWPLGSGFGSFASEYAFINYSKLYYDYDLYFVRGLEPYAGRYNGISSFLLDTHWPHIIAELGFLGFLIYMIMFFYFPFKSVFISSEKFKKLSLSFLLLSMFFGVFIDSLGGTTIEQTNFAFFIGLVGIYIYKTLKNID